MQVDVQLPDVDPEVDEEGDAVEVTLGRCQMKGGVPVVIVLLGLASVIIAVWLRKTRLKFVGTDLI